MKKRQIPHTYAIIFYIILFCAALTWIIPGGQYKESINAAGEISFAKPLHRRIKFIRYHTNAQVAFLQPFQQRQNPLVGCGFVRHVCLIICLIFRQTSRKNRLLRPLRQSRPHQKLTPISQKFSDFFFPPQRKAVRL